MSGWIVLCLKLFFNLKKSKAKCRDALDNYSVALEPTFAIKEFYARIFRRELNFKVKRLVGKEISKTDRKLAIGFLALNVHLGTAVNVCGKLFARAPFRKLGDLSASFVVSEYAFGTETGVLSSALAVWTAVCIENEEFVSISVFI